MVVAVLARLYLFDDVDSVARTTTSLRLRDVPSLDLLHSLGADLELLATWCYYGALLVREDPEVPRSATMTQLALTACATLAWLVIASEGRFLLNPARKFVVAKRRDGSDDPAPTSHRLMLGVFAESLPQIASSLVIDKATMGSVSNAGTVNVFTSLYGVFLCCFVLYEEQRTSSLRDENDHNASAVPLDQRTSSSSLVRSYVGHTGEVRAVANLDGEFFVSGAEDSTCRLWHRGTGECVRTLRCHAGPVCAVSTVPGAPDKVLTASIDATARLWNARTGERLRTYAGHALCVWSLCCLPSEEDGNGRPRRRFLSGSSDRTVREWDLDGGDCVAVYEGHSEPVLAIAAVDRYTFLTGSKDATVRLWHRESRRNIRTFVGHDNWVWDFAALPLPPTSHDHGEERFVSCGEDGTVRLWHVDAAECLRTCVGHAGPVNTVVAVDHERVLSGSDDKTTRLWNVTEGTCLREYRGHDGVVWSLALVGGASSTGRYFLTASSDRTNRLWRLDEGEANNNTHTPTHTHNNNHVNNNHRSRNDPLRLTTSSSTTTSTNHHRHLHGGSTDDEETRSVQSYVSRASKQEMPPPVLTDDDDDDDYDDEIGAMEKDDDVEDPDLESRGYSRGSSRSRRSSS